MEVIYRKYRPRTFDKVIGQEHVTAVLEEQIKNNSMNHAYLFSGSRGTGKTTVARIFATALNGNESGNSIDIIEIDAASNRGIDDIRELRERITYVPSKSKYKIYIIDEVHMLTKEAFNALLKTLEEPPEHAIFILATTEPHKVPITILSRVTRFDFKLASTSDLHRKFEYILRNEKIKFEESALEVIVKYSNGSYRDGESLLSKVLTGLEDKSLLTLKDVHKIIGLVEQETVENILEALKYKDTVSVIKIFNSLKEEGKNLDVVFSQIINQVHTLLIESVENKLNGFSITQLINIINELTKAVHDSKQDIIQGLVYELALIKLTLDNKTLPTSEVEFIPNTKGGGVLGKDKNLKSDKIIANLNKELKTEPNIKQIVVDSDKVGRRVQIIEDRKINMQRVSKLQQDWKSFVRKISEEHFQLAALLINTEFIYDEASSVLTIEVPYSYYKQKLESKETRIAMITYLQNELEVDEVTINIKYNPNLKDKAKENKSKDNKETNKEIVEEIFNI